MEIKVESKKKIGLMPMLLLVIVGVSAIIGIASVIVFKSFTPTATLITNADFKIYSNAGCTTEITTIALGDVKRLEQKQVTFWLKFNGAPEIPLKMSWTKNGVSTDATISKMEFYQTATWFDVAENIQFADTITSANYATTIIQCRATWTVTGTASLGIITPQTLILNANNPIV